MNERTRARQTDRNLNNKNGYEKKFFNINNGAP